MLRSVAATALVAASAAALALGIDGAQQAHSVSSQSLVAVDVPAGDTVDAQAWWSPMPGTGKTGHLHLGGTLPLNRTVTTATLPLPLKWQAHDLEGTVVRDIVVQVEDGNGALLFKELLSDGRGGFHGFKATLDHHEGVLTYELPLTGLPSGRLNLNLTMRGFLSDGRLLRTITHWPIVVDNGNPPVAVPASSHVSGGGWFPRPPENAQKYTTVSVTDGQLRELLDGTKSGELSVTFTTDGPYQRVMVDPAFHAMPPRTGLVVFEQPAATNVHPAGEAKVTTRTIKIDTSVLADGPHRIVIQGRRDRTDGEHSGLLVLPFTVDNPDPAYHPACEPTCDQQIAQLRDDVAGREAEIAELRARIERAKAVLTG